MATLSRVATHGISALMFLRVAIATLSRASWRLRNIFWIFFRNGYLILRFFFKKKKEEDICTFCTDILFLFWEKYIFSEIAILFWDLNFRNFGFNNIYSKTQLHILQTTQLLRWELLRFRKNMSVLGHPVCGIWNTSTDSDSAPSS